MPKFLLILPNKVERGAHGRPFVLSKEGDEDSTHHGHVVYTDKGHDPAGVLVPFSANETILDAIRKSGFVRRGAAPRKAPVQPVAVEEKPGFWKRLFGRA